MPEWNHDKAFRALLCLEGQAPRDLTSSNNYVHLYRQKQNCAILYSPDATKAFRENPLHIKMPDCLRESAKKDWKPELFEQLRPFIELDHRDKNRFDWYSVSNWNGFGTALKLALP